MATKKISAMTAATALTGAELVPIVQWGANKQVPFNLMMEYSSPLIEGLQALGSVIKGMSLKGLPDTTVTLVDGRQQMVAVYLRKAAIITGVKWCQITQGNYTANNNNRIGLYSQAAGVLTLEASCANDGDLWKGAAGVITKAFSAPVALAAGVYYIGYLYNSSEQTTAPQIGGSALSVYGYVLDCTNSNSLCAYVVTTDLKASTTSMSDITGAQTSPAFFLLY